MRDLYPHAGTNKAYLTYAAVSCHLEGNLKSFVIAHMLQRHMCEVWMNDSPYEIYIDNTTQSRYVDAMMERKVDLPMAPYQSGDHWDQTSFW